MGKWTQGPWRWSQGAHDWELCGADQNRVLFRWGDSAGLNSGLVIGETLKPEDAALIAAAPDMAEALSEMIAAMVDYEMEAETEAPASHREMMRKARAALAKANGNG